MYVYDQHIILVQARTSWSKDTNSKKHIEVAMHHALASW